MHTAIKSTVTSLLLVSLILTPIVSFAKENGEKSNKDNEHRNDKAKNSIEIKTGGKVNCLSTYTRLILSGTIKLDEATSAKIAEECKWPFGIRKHQATTTIDTTAPSLFFIHARPGVKNAVVSWITNEKTDAQVAFGLDANYGSTTVIKKGLGIFHTVTIRGLAPSTTYHFKVMSKDKSGNLASSGDMTFTTTATTPASDTVPPIISALLVSGLGSTTATISWNTNELANSKVYFGTSTPFSTSASNTGSVQNGTLVLNHSLNIGSLLASTTYNYVIQSDDGSGNRATSSVGSFITLP